MISLAPRRLNRRLDRLHGLSLHSSRAGQEDRPFWQTIIAKIGLAGECVDSFRTAMERWVRGSPLLRKRYSVYDDRNW